MHFEAEQATRRVGAGVAGAGALAVRRVARLHIDGNAGVQAAVGTFDDVQEPVAIFHRVAPGSGPGGCAGWFPPAWPWSTRPARDRGQWR